jgi:hypothetical protein
MDRATLRELNELTGEGTQTYIKKDDTMPVTGDFYRVVCATNDVKINAISIKGTAINLGSGITCPAGVEFHNVTSITLDDSIEQDVAVVAYTAPALTGNIE